MSAANGSHAGLGKSKVFHLPLLNQLFHRSCCIFNGNIGINPMLIKQINNIGLKALKRSFSDLLNVLRPTVCAHTLSCSGIDLEAELGGYGYLLTNRRQCFSDKLFIYVRAIDLGRIKERYPQFDRFSDERNTLLLLNRRAEPKAHPHAAQSYC